MRGDLTDPSPPWAFPLLATPSPGILLCSQNTQHIPPDLSCISKAPAAPALSGAISTDLVCPWNLSVPASPVPLSLLSPFLPLPAQARSQIGLPKHPCPSKQSFTVAGFYRGRKALLAYGSSGQSFQGPLSSQIPCPGAEGCFWKDRSRNPTGSKSSVMCQQYTRHLISLNPPHSLEVTIAIHIFQRKKPRIQEATEFVEHHTVGSGANIVEAGLPESTACALKPLLTPPSPCGGHGYSYLLPSLHLGMLTPVCECPHGVKDLVN